MVDRSIDIVVRLSNLHSTASCKSWSSTKRRMTLRTSTTGCGQLLPRSLKLSLTRGAYVMLATPKTTPSHGRIISFSGFWRWGRDRGRSPRWNTTSGWRSSTAPQKRRTIGLSLCRPRIKTRCLIHRWC